MGFSGISILSILTAYLYCSGSAYIEGYLSIFHLDPNTLSIGFHQVLYRGMITNLPSILMGVLALSYIAVVLFVVVPLIQDKDKGFGFRTKVKIKAKSEIKSKISSVIAVCLSLILGILLFVFIMKSYEDEGVLDARKVLWRIDNNINSSVSINDSKSDSLAFLYCGTHVCAGLDVKSLELEYFPSDSFRVQPALEDVNWKEVDVSTYSLSMLRDKLKSK